MVSLTTDEGEKASHSSVMKSADGVEASVNFLAENEGAQTSAKTQASQDALERQAAQQMLGDRTVYKTYFKSVGWLHTTIFLIGAMAWSISFKFSGK